MKATSGPRTVSGIRRQLEATLDINAAELLCAYVGSEGSGDLHRDPAVPKAGRLADDQRPAHELGMLVGNLQQFSGGHAGGRRGGGHAENVDRLGRHSKK